jgi:hypothetical protein
MVYELRIYHAVPGRLPDLNNRFSTITLKLWDKFGIRQVGFWTTLVGPSNNALYYLLEWESLAEREQKWNAFAAHPTGWRPARKRKERAAGRAHREHVAHADRLFEAEVRRGLVGCSDEM